MTNITKSWMSKSDSSYFVFHTVIELICLAEANTNLTFCRIATRWFFNLCAYCAVFIDKLFTSVSKDKIGNTFRFLLFFFSHLFVSFPIFTLVFVAIAWNRIVLSKLHLDYTCLTGEIIVLNSWQTNVCYQCHRQVHSAYKSWTALRTFPRPSSVCQWRHVDAKHSGIGQKWSCIDLSYLITEKNKPCFNV